MLSPQHKLMSFRQKWALSKASSLAVYTGSMPVKKCLSGRLGVRSVVTGQVLEKHGQVEKT